MTTRRYELEIITTIDSHTVEFCIDENNNILNCDEIPELPIGSHRLVIHKSEFNETSGLMLCMPENGNKFIRDTKNNCDEDKKLLEGILVEER